MSLARAFTTRRTKKVSEISSPLPQRSNTNKNALGAGTIRHKISGPVELLSTTNMLSYSAPDLFPGSTTLSTSPPPSSSVPSLTHSSSSSTHSSSSNGESNASSPPTSPEATGRSPSPNHLSCYFGQSNSDSEDVSVPAIPQRSPSHTKRTHEIVHRKRSISRMSQKTSHSVKNSISSFTRDSMQMFSATPELTEDVERTDSPSSMTISTPSASPAPPQSSASLHSKKMSHAQVIHPFGPELAQVSELAEEYGNGVKIVDPEEQQLLDLGLLKWDVRDYLVEVDALYGDAFATESKQEWF